MPAFRQPAPGRKRPTTKKLEGWDARSNHYFLLDMRRPGEKSSTTTSSRAFVTTDGKVVFKNLGFKPVVTRPITAINDKFIFKADDGTEIIMQGGDAFILLRG